MRSTGVTPAALPRLTKGVAIRGRKRLEEELANRIGRQGHHQVHIRTALVVKIFGGIIRLHNEEAQVKRVFNWLRCSCATYTSPEETIIPHGIGQTQDHCCAGLLFLRLYSFPMAAKIP